MFKLTLNIAFRTQALEHIIDTMNLELAWQGDQRHLGRLQAEGASATLAVEVGMHVVDRAIILTAMAIGAAHGILEHASAVVDGMDEVMGQEQRNGAVDGRFVHRVQLVLQALQREGVVMSHHRAQQQYAHGGGLDVVLLQSGDIFTLVLHHVPQTKKN